MSASPYAELIAGEWLRRVSAEYTSAARTHVFTHWLIQLGASPDLIRAGLRIVDDELAHAELSAAVVAEAAGEARAPALSQEGLDLARRSPDLLSDVIAECLEIFCMGETVAVPLFSEMRKGCDVAVARAALDRILLDEVRHRDFGWTTLEWLLQLDEVRVHAEVQAQLLRAFRLVRRHYAGVDSVERDEAKARELHRWGLIPGERYSEILERCAQRDYLPRLSKLGWEAEGAWREAAQG